MKESLLNALRIVLAILWGALKIVIKFILLVVALIVFVAWIVGLLMGDSVIEVLQSWFLNIN